MFIIEFNDLPEPDGGKGKLWLVQPDVNGPAIGYRSQIPDVPTFWRLVAHGFKVINGPQQGGTLYAPVAW